MAETKFKGNPVHTVGELPAVGSALPAFTLTGSDLGDLTSDSLAGRKVILNIFPSLDTGTCAASVRTFNKKAAGLQDTTVLCVSNDLPFAQARFCGAEGIENVTTASGFRSTFGDDFGVTMTDGPLKGLLARSVVVVDASGKVAYTQLISEIADEPDYDSALEAADKA
ncbi:MAG: thiol peroxidase [Acidipropionibacterium sp.]|jgi:thiol peroxidase|nr:thiol peroxidase [Acidipropionibacterium sp.]